MGVNRDTGGKNPPHLLNQTGRKKHVYALVNSNIKLVSRPLRSDQKRVENRGRPVAVPVSGKRLSSEFEDLERTEYSLSIVGADSGRGFRIDGLETAEDRIRVLLPLSPQPGTEVRVPRRGRKQALDQRADPEMAASDHHRDQAF